MKYKSNDNFIIDEAAGDKVLIPISSSVADMGNMLVLNETSSFILELVKEPISIDDIVVSFQKEYDCPEESELRSDIETFINQMIDKGFISTNN